MGKWDLYLKMLVWESPQDFVSLLLSGARYLGRREGEFQTREIRSDGMLEVEYAGERLLIHIEFQVKKEENIGERLLDYNYAARRAYGLPVLSCLIYIKHVFEPPRSPFTWDVPGWGESLSFKYLSIELAEIPVEELEQKQLEGISPLLLLSKGGATRKVLDQAVTRLEIEQNVEVLAITRLIAAMVFADNEDKAWVERRFMKMEEFFESSPWYQEIVRKGELLGREEGIRRSIETVVQTRFPALLELARERLEHLSNQEMVQQVLVAMSAAQSEKEARRYLLALNNDQ